MKQRLSDRLNARLERHLPEQRLFMKSEEGTRFVRMRPLTQASVLLGGALVLGWTVVVTSFFLIGAITSGSNRDQTARAQIAYETRLAALSSERDIRAAESEQALERFYAALEEVSKMQGIVLASEQRVRELETGIEVIQRTLRRTVTERNEARDAVETLEARLEGAPEAAALAERLAADSAATAEALATVLDSTAKARDDAMLVAETADAEIARMEALAEVMADRNDRIFTRLEDALETSLAPLDRVFSRAGISSDALLQSVRSGYAGQGGPLEPVVLSTRGGGNIPDIETDRANRILDKLDDVGMYRSAAESLPIAHPVSAPHRRTSGFGPRWGRMHSGMDFASSRGTPIQATADGVVTHAGWQSGYGKLIKIEHALGFETRYAHLNSINVSVGQRVSRGQTIGGMGTTGRSTGVHLHYEIRRGGQALNPLTFINAGQDVF
ncbi:M23 family metallopeptidase [Jannaschia pohangensis]|uniref:Murein DD-endopeptidase MepM and murein hydrolase activator NlpD, contain LysM domain n=1 Tax=Jannaschia pohangensis TaxID=390807 RepID=A0A1I3I4T3_9RHOB|nr:M23 family metallopeptidase [Jannaschia pohangensis]SFI42922.1 Murein DD-endopeptidase MepM and murein hydrolase activator NlpD, contain LysM domain [Jannaschia pohangensis]